jgi:hypothetical protein
MAEHVAYAQEVINTGRPTKLPSIRMGRSQSGQTAAP